MFSYHGLSIAEFSTFCKRELPVHKIALYFSEGSGRPTKELFAALGAMILQQMHDLTDEETVVEFSFKIKWHFALDIPGESDESKYLSPKTLRKMAIKRLRVRGLAAVCCCVILKATASISSGRRGSGGR